METEDKTPILNVAWNRFAHFDAIANERTGGYTRLRRWIAILGVLTTLFAVLAQIYPKEFPAILGVAVKIVLIALPIISSILAAFTNKFFGGGDWLVMRAGAEQILMEIYKYRTILQKSPDRRVWLEKQLADIQQQVYRGMGGEMVIKPYKGPIPPYDDPTDPTDDAGFSDLTGEQYFRFRVESQLAWHMKKVNQFQNERVRLQIFILLAGGAGAFLAALDFSMWVALTASIAAALIGWQELRNLDERLKNYSKVVLELMAISDHWQNLTDLERTEAEFYSMVENTEKVLWSQNVEYIKSMQETVTKVGKADESLIDDVLKKSVEADARFKKEINQALVAQAEKSIEEGEKAVVDEFKKTLATLAEEVNSPLVQAELAEMEKAAAEAVKNVVTSISGGLNASLQAIAEEFKDVKVTGDTPVSVLNSLLVRYPPTSEPKG
jgi:hypothetical protein